MIGCWFESGIAYFRVYASKVSTVQIHLLNSNSIFEMIKDNDGHWIFQSNEFKPGDLYQYSIDHQNAYPDPATRFQPEGVHGPSMGIDPRQFHWQNPHPGIPDPSSRIIYELHIGTFTPQGTFLAAIDRLGYLRDLGVNCIELMPVADFPGERGWGYDGVSIFAPARCYGTCSDLQHFIDRAHQFGLCVLLDVVYNHLGPDGNYTGVYSDTYLNPKHQTPWGDALNYDGKGSIPVRNYFIQNALFWLKQYRFDGLRLDATHAICDDSPIHFLSELTQSIRSQIQERDVLLYAEDHRNPAYFCQEIAAHGFGLDGVWADDLHHHLRRHTAFDNEGYFAPFDGTVDNICKTLERGWFRDGSLSQGILAEGTDPSQLDYSKFVVCIQNHDQIGNRAMGERIHHQVTPSVYKALSALLLFAPETPLLFMGQEWGCSTPFQFFTDHEAQLGAMVTQGRRKEFKGFKAFADPAAREQIPDPQALTTLTRSKLNWQEISHAEHQGIIELYKRLLNIRLHHPAMKSVLRTDFKTFALSRHSLAMIRRSGDSTVICIICLQPTGELLPIPPTETGYSAWCPILLTEENGAMAEAQMLHFQSAGAWLAESLHQH